MVNDRVFLLRDKIVGLNAAARQPLADEIELIECLVTDRKLARSWIPVCRDANLEAKEFFKMILDRLDVGISCAMAGPAF